MMPDKMPALLTVCYQGLNARNCPSCCVKEDNYFCISWFIPFKTFNSRVGDGVCVFIFVKFYGSESRDFKVAAHFIWQGEYHINDVDCDSSESKEKSSVDGHSVKTQHESLVCAISMAQQILMKLPDNHHAKKWLQETAICRHYSRLISERSKEFPSRNEHISDKDGPTATALINSGLNMEQRPTAAMTTYKRLCSASECHWVILPLEKLLFLSQYTFVGNDELRSWIPWLKCAKAQRSTAACQIRPGFEQINLTILLDDKVVVNSQSQSTLLDMGLRNALWNFSSYSIITALQRGTSSSPTGNYIGSQLPISQSDELFAHSPVHICLISLHCLITFPASAQLVMATGPQPEEGKTVQEKTKKDQVKHWRVPQVSSIRNWTKPSAAFRQKRVQHILPCGCLVYMTFSNCPKPALPVFPDVEFLLANNGLLAHHHRVLDSQTGGGKERGLQRSLLHLVRDRGSWTGRQKLYFRRLLLEAFFPYVLAGQRLR
ncbi:hypothetical protein Nmel_006084, partial [Mimus melanotis]